MRCPLHTQDGSNTSTPGLLCSKGQAYFGFAHEEATAPGGTVTEASAHFKINQLFIYMDLAEQSSIYSTLALFKY